MNEHPHQSTSRAERARIVADYLIEAHRQLTELDPLAEYGDLLDHLARRARLAHETARHAAAEPRR